MQNINQMTFHQNCIRRRGYQVATRQSIDECIERCGLALANARTQYGEGMKQEHYEDYTYSASQLGLQEALNDLEKLSLSANDQQKDQIYRMRLQLQQVQNEMILLDH